ncbi:MAG: FHA domain-containing protein [Planctomycetaceae bacterium]
MPITLTAISGPEPGRVLQLQSGQAAVVGRGEGLDFAFADDPLMSTRHFQIEGRPDCGLLTDLRSTNGTFVNGERVTDVIVGTGDQILAGQTTFAVAAGTAAKAAAVTPAAPAKGLDVSFDAPAQELCEGMTLTDGAQPLLNGDLSAAEFVGQLQQHSLFADALRVLSRAMGTRAALLWSCGCVEDQQKDKLSDSDRHALEAAAKWATKPSDAAAAAAYEAAAELQNNGPAALLAQAAYWATGNVSPPGQPPIPVDPQIPSQAIAGALTLTAVDGAPEDAAGKYEEFIRRALAAAEK